MAGEDCVESEVRAGVPGTEDITEKAAVPGPGGGSEDWEECEE